MDSDNDGAPVELFRDRGFSGSMGFGNRPALIVVDLTRGFTDPAARLGAPSASVIDQANRLLDAAHRTGVPVFLTTIQYDHADLRDAGVWPRKIAGLRDLLANSPAVQQDPRLHRDAADTVIAKQYASSFFGTDLNSRLRAAGVDTLIIAGTSTSGCVRATAVDACQYGFRPIVVREAVVDRSAAAHRQALVDVETKYGDIVDIERTLEYLHSMEHGGSTRAQEAAC